jgi:transcriptional activator of cad operon
MSIQTATRWRVGAWSVDPAAGVISRDGETVRVEARTLRLLQCLAERAGEVVSIDDLLDAVWPDVAVTPDSVYQAVASLRRLLGDDPKNPTYIATAPRQGYRLIAPVAPLTAGLDSAGPPAGTSLRRPISRQIVGATSLAVALALGVGVALLNNHPPTAAASSAPAPTSIAVMPFLDLTSEAMTQEYVADGMTEELIDRLSEVPGFRVAPLRSASQFKGKPLAVDEVGRTLHVTYVLDGSLRKSGAKLRIAVRLIQADSGFVAWTQSYDRPAGDVLRLQDEIAKDVAATLKKRVGG